MWPRPRVLGFVFTMGKVPVSIPFARSVRALEADRLVGLTIVLGATVLLGAAWPAQLLVGEMRVRRTAGNVL